MTPTPPPPPPPKIEPKSVEAKSPLAIKYPLRLLPGPGEESVGVPPTQQLATPSGGTSGAGDTTRTAGYVVDLSKTNVRPPGPPVVIEPTLVAGPEAVTPPPKPQAAKPPPTPPTV